MDCSQRISDRLCVGEVGMTALKEEMISNYKLDN